MEKIYKVLDANMTSSNWRYYKVGEVYTAPGGRLGTKDVINCYTHPIVAALMQPVFGSTGEPRMFVGEGSVDVRDDVLRCGCTFARLLAEIDIPFISNKQSVDIAIRCVLQYCDSNHFIDWADRWLDGSDVSFGGTKAVANILRSTKPRNSSNNLLRWVCIDAVRAAAASISGTDSIRSETRRLVCQSINWCPAYAREVKANPLDIMSAINLVIEEAN